MKRIATILGVLLGVAIPLATAAPGEAHVAPAPHLSCGELDGHFTNFPAGPQTVTLHYSVDGIEQPPVTQTGTGPAFDTSVGYYNADAGSHVLSARFTWTADGGGSSPIATTTIDRCPPPLTRTTTIIQRVEVPTPPAPPQLCTSNRRIAFWVRPRYPGASNAEGNPVLTIDRSKLNRATGERGAYTGVDSEGRVIHTSARIPRTGSHAGRIRVVIDARGHKFNPYSNDLRTTVWLKTSTGTWRTLYVSAVCRSQQGNPNDQRARTVNIPG